MLLKNKVEIEEWLKINFVFDYKLISDEKYGYVVNVNYSVHLSDLNLKSIDVKFNIIKGSFYCCFNKLDSLKGCPEIVKIDFWCNNNKLETLLYGPKIVEKNFFCHKNELKSLKGCPEEVNGHFDCSDNENLDSLIFYPKIIVGELDLFNCNLNLDGLINLEFIDVQSNYIDLRQNKELNNLNDIANVNELKEIVKIYKEKSAIMRFVEKKDFNIVNTVIINKSIKQINKI